MNTWGGKQAELPDKCMRGMASSTKPKTTSIHSRQDLLDSEILAAQKVKKRNSFFCPTSQFTLLMTTKLQLR